MTSNKAAKSLAEKMADNIDMTEGHIIWPELPDVSGVDIPMPEVKPPREGDVRVGALADKQREIQRAGGPPYSCLYCRERVDPPRGSYYLNDLGFFCHKECAHHYADPDYFPPSIEEDLLAQPHYTAGEIEPIDYIKAQGWLPAFAAGNIVKYVTRYPHKNGVEDLKKARVYLDWLIEEVEIAET